MDELTVTIEGTKYTVPYELFKDSETHEETVQFLLPDCSERTTVLRGLTIESVIKPHLISYHQSTKKEKD